MTALDPSSVSVFATCQRQSRKYEVEIAEDAFKTPPHLGQLLDILEAVIEKPKS
jgi:hypothetical protein